MIDYRRKNAPAGIATITLGSNPDREHGYLGVGVLDAPWAPFTIDFNLANIGGPSAGLMFSLAVVDKLTTGDLNGSASSSPAPAPSPATARSARSAASPTRCVAAHEAGATVFLVPADNCDEAKSAHEDGLELVKVDNLGQAVDALEHVFRWWRTSPLLRDRRAGGCVELWHVTHDVRESPRLELTSGYAARGENAEADAT